MGRLRWVGRGLAGSARPRDTVAS